MGQFRPTLQARRSPPLDLILFAVGFLLSSVVSFALVAWGGEAVASALPLRSRLVLLLGVVLVLLGVEIRRLRQGLHCSVGLRRQTPRRLGFHPIGPLLWGLDTGLPWTTYRTTPLPWIGLAAVALGFGHSWIGLAYAAGFLGSLTASCLWPGSGGKPQPEPRDPRQSDLLRLIQTLQAHTRSARTASLVLGSGLALLVAARVLALL